MGKYGDIPVGEHAGTANVSVPIYEIQTRQGAVPISLNYHTGGVRVAQEAEWTGLGWSLQAGGSITRAIRGLDDFGDHVGHCVNAPFENYYQRGIGNNASGSPRGNLINPGYYEYASDLGADFTCMVDRHITGIPVRITAPDGVKATTQYNCTYLVPSLFRETYTDGTSIVQSQVLQFNTQGYPVSLQIFGFPSNESYVWNNGLLESKSYLNWQHHFDYYTNRTLKSSQGIDGQKAEFIYDPYQRLYQIKARPFEPGSTNFHIQTEITYQMGGNNVVRSKTTYSDAPSRIVEKHFDGLGRPVREILNGVLKKHIVYDQSDRVQRQTLLPGNYVAFEYDGSPLGRMILELLPDGATRKHKFTVSENCPGTAVTDEKGNTSQMYQDFLGRQSKIKDALNHNTTFKYFKHGGVKTVQPPSGSAYTYQYDNRRRLIYKKIPGARAQILRYYDENNLLKYTIDGKGQRIDHYYDEYLRERRTTLATVTNWDPQSSSASHGAPGSDILITRYGEEFPDLPQIYKGRVRQTEAKLFGDGPVTASGFTQTTFSYDNFGRAINRSETFPLLPGSGTGTDTWELLFDHADRLKFEGRSHAGAASVSTTHSHEYDHFGRELYYSFGAGQPSGAAVAMNWNDRDQMTSKKLGYAGNLSLDLIGYRYNERGWLTDINDVIRERWETPYAICQGEAGEEETSQQEEKVPLSELLQMLCRGESVAVQGADPCAQGDCTDELADRIIEIRHEVALGGPRPTVTLSLHGLHIGGTPIGLPRLPYRWDFGPAGLTQNDSLALLSDLSVWLQTNGYRFDSLQLRLLPPDWNQKSSTVGLRLSILQTNLSLSHAFYSINNQTPYSRVTVRKENIRFVACRAIPTPEQEPRIIGLAQSTSQLQYPTALYRVRMDNSAAPVWRFGGELVTAGQNYRRELRIPVQNAQERFSILMTGDSIPVVWTLAQLLTQRQQNGLSGVASIERVIEKTNTNPCTLPPLNCSEKQTELQNAALAQIQNLLCSTNAAQLSYPVTLYQVALCNGGTAYILGQQQLQMLPQPVQIIAQLPITGPDQALTVVVTRRRPLLAMKFRYEPNGNIRELQWKVTRQDVKYYENDYDPINRLLGSNYGIEREVQPAIGAAYIERVNTQDYNEFGIEYDPIGNIKKLSRRGLIPAADCFTPGLIDNLSYSYGDEGRLTAVSDAAPEPYRQEGFKPAAAGGPQATHYQYDHNGNLTDDAHKNMQFDYNFLNLALNITTTQGTLHFLYDATGRKWAKSGPDGIRFYAGNIEYLDGKIQHIAFPDGRLVAEYNTSGTSVTGYRSEYFRTDHLGNTRLTFSDFNQDGLISWKLPTAGPAAQESEITSENHYYPFGLSQKGPWYASVAPENKYRYNGKEWNDEWGLGLYDFGNRWHDPTLGRFTTVDRFAEKYAFQSAYVMAANDPMKFVDVNGDSIFIRTGKGKENIALYDNGVVTNRDGTKYTGKGVKERKDGSVKLQGFLKQTVNALDKIRSGGPVGSNLVSTLEKDNDIFVITKGPVNDARGRAVHFNPASFEAGLDVNGSRNTSPFVSLAHELAHALDWDNGSIDTRTWITYSDNKTTSTRAEIYASHVENQIRAENNLPLREFYGIDQGKGVGRLLIPGTRMSAHYMQTQKVPTLIQIPFKY